MMIAPYGFHPFERRIPGMYCIVHASIQKVPEDESGKKRKSISAHKKEHNRKNNGRNDKARHRRHKQPLLISREFMVVSVEHIADSLNSRIVTRPMKNEAVHDVFKKSPEKYSA
jgi:hypothetical protein